MLKNKEIADLIYNNKNNGKQLNDNVIADFALMEIPLTEKFSLVVDYERIDESEMEYLGSRCDTRLALYFKELGNEDYIYPSDMDCEDYSKRSGGSLGWYSEYGVGFPSKKNIYTCVVNAIRDFKEYINKP